MRNENILAWHFAREDRKLRDGNSVAAGYVYTVDPPLELCSWGLHASIDPLDALTYAPGPIVSRVECRGEILHGDDKLACTEREHLWVANATAVLREFARWCAMEVIGLWDAPDVVRRYLQTGDESTFNIIRTTQYYQ